MQLIRLWTLIQCLLLVLLLYLKRSREPGRSMRKRLVKGPRTKTIVQGYKLAYMHAQSKFDWSNNFKSQNFGEVHERQISLNPFTIKVLWSLKLSNYLIWIFGCVTLCDKKKWNCPQWLWVELFPYKIMWVSSSIYIKDAFRSFSSTTKDVFILWSFWVRLLPWCLNLQPWHL